MKVIKNALDQALRKESFSPRKGWWGCYHENSYKIMRYGHTMIIFDEKKLEVTDSVVTRTDINGVRDAKLMIEDWQQSNRSLF